MIALMMYAVVTAGLVGLAAAMVERGLRRVSAAGRWAWVGAILLSVALPAVALWRPGGRGTAGTVESATGAVASTTLASNVVAIRDPSFLDGLASRAAVLQRSVESARRALMIAGSNPTANRAALALCLLASLAMLGTVLAAAARLASARRTWGLAVIGEQFVRVSDDVGPAVVGFLRGEIVVPWWALELTPERREMLLAHEREHLQARDPLVLLGALAALVLMPWNPAVWWQVRRLRLAVEMDCDRRVLRRGGDVRAYGALLIEVGRRSTRAPLAAAAFSEPATHLERRIHMMLAGTPRWSAVRATALALAGLGIALVACDLQPPTGVAPETEVALASLGATGQSYNVTEGLPLTDIRAAIEARHPELLQEQGARTWVVQLTLDSSGRIIRSGKMLDRRTRVIELTAPGLEAGRARALVRAPEGEVEVVRDLMPVPAEVAAARERDETVLIATAVDTTRLQADRIELAPFPATGKLLDARDGTILEPSVIDARPTRNRILARPGSRRRTDQPEGALELDKIDAERIESIEVIKGAAITGLTPAVSGVIVIRMKW